MVSMSNEGQKQNPIRHRLNVIIFGTDTFAGRAFDLLLIVSIICSVSVVMLDSVVNIKTRHGTILNRLEWFFTVMFTVDYMLRIYCSPRPLRYTTSFFGIIDLLAIIPTYLGMVIAGGSALGVIRLLRVLRIFRVLKLALYVREANVLVAAMVAARRKILVFFFAVITLVTILGSIMYVVERGHNSGFDSIPRSIYWAIVTLTTVGYGDISPQTPLGQFIASIVMILGYSIIAVPTGIVTAQMVSSAKNKNDDQAKSTSESNKCPHCGKHI